MNSKFYISILIALVLFSCKPDQLTEKQLAEIQLGKIDSLFKANNTLAASQLIDSLHDKYGKEVSVLKQADTIKYKIELIEQKRNLVYSDSLIPILEKAFNEGLKKFKFEKDEKYQSIGHYIYKPQLTELNAARTYIKAYVDEDGKYYISSYYAGKYFLKHSSVKFEVKKLNESVETTPLDEKSGYANSYKDDEICLENNIYIPSKSNEDIAAFVNTNSGTTIVITLLGEKSNYVYYLSSTEKKAITEAYAFSKVVSEFKKVLHINNVAQKKIVVLEERLNNK